MDYGERRSVFFVPVTIKLLAIYFSFSLEHGFLLCVHLMIWYSTIYCYLISQLLIHSQLELWAILSAISSSDTFTTLLYTFSQKNNAPGTLLVHLNLLLQFYICTVKCFRQHHDRSHKSFQLHLGSATAVLDTVTIFYRECDFQKRKKKCKALAIGRLKWFLFFRESIGHMHVLLHDFSDSIITMCASHVHLPESILFPQNNS